MSTLGAVRNNQKSTKKCGKCAIPISWVEICEQCTDIVYKPLYTFWPPPPTYLTEFDFFETADAYVNPPNWNKEMTQSCGDNIIDCTYSISHTCVNAASNVQQVGSPRSEHTDVYLYNDTFRVQFAWYGARRNPLYPGTYGAPQYIRELIPTKSLANDGIFDRPRRVYQRNTKTFTQYKGWIDCVCGEPSECGCS